MKRAVKRIIMWCFRHYGYDIVRSSNESKIETIVPEILPDDVEIIKKIEPYTMTSIERQWSLLNALKYVNKANIPGDVVECGVWRGGSALLAKLVNKHANVDRKIWLYDTFRGMPEPKNVDVDLQGVSAQHRFLKDQRNNHNDWCYSSLMDVKSTFSDNCVLDDTIKFIVGKVEETLTKPENIPEKIAVLRLDTDWYESTRVEIETLYPKLVRGGVLIVDDYGHWQGARRAVDEFFSDTPVLLQRIDYTGRLIIKI